VSAGRIAGLLVALIMVAGGAWLAAAGMGWLGASGSTSRSWSEIGSILAGLGVALGYVVLTRRG
jgi:hypothetical protein